MSKLEQLINELCTDGVEFVKIKDCFTRIKGTPITANKMKEIADLIGSTEAAVKQKHYRICNKLRKSAKKFEKNY